MGKMKTRRKPPDRRRLMAFLLALLLCAPLYQGFWAQAATTRLRVAVHTGFPIYQFLDESGACAGVHIDMLNDIAARQSLEITYIPFRTDSECFAALDNGTVDVILGAKAIVPPEYNFLRSDYISTSTLCLVTSKQLALGIEEGKRISAEMCTAEIWYDISPAMPNRGGLGLWSGTFRICNSQTEVIENLIQGNAEMAVCEKESALFLLNHYRASDDYVIAINYLNKVEYTMLLRNGDTALLRRLNLGITETRASGAYDRIMEKWIESHHSGLSLVTIRRGLTILGLVILLLLAYILVSRRLNAVLTRLVNEKTCELGRVNTILEEKMLQLQNESEVRNGILENAPNGMMLFNAAYEITFMNRIAADMTGGRRMGGSAKDVAVFGDILKQKERSIFFGVDFQMVPETIELSHGGKSQIYRYIIYRLVKYQEVTGALLSVENVTREEAEKHALFEQEKNKSLNTLIAGIAHEIKNPLTSIRTYSTLIPTRLNNPEFLASFAKFVPMETERINRLVETLIDYARPARNRMEPLNLSEIAADCLYLSQTVIAKGMAEFSTNLADDIMIFANKDQMKQVIINQPI